jgi:NADP-dependent 3-hydroxy acid dehydrogenase YdfG
MHPGLHVIATARNKETIKGLEKIGMSTVSLEVTSSESIAAARKEVEALTGGKLDILVNNAYVKAQICSDFNVPDLFTHSRWNKC